MAIQRELWAREINENLYAALAPVLKAATDDSKYVASKTVHIPNAGSPATIQKNPTLPLSTGTRTDNDLTYNIDTYAINPVAVPDYEQAMLEYDKFQSVLNDITMGLPERVRAELTISWYTDATNKVLTTGAAYAAHAPAATGTRKGLTTAELKAAAAKLDQMKVPQGDRFFIVDTVMWYQLLDELGISSYRDAVMAKESGQPDIPLYGFNIIVLPSVAYCSATYTVRAYGATGAATDQAIALAVHKSAISYAFGSVEVFEEVSASYLGRVVSGYVQAGGSYRRYDKLGVVPVIQAATA